MQKQHVLEVLSPIDGNALKQIANFPEKNKICHQ